MNKLLFLFAPLLALTLVCAAQGQPPCAPYYQAPTYAHQTQVHEHQTVRQRTVVDVIQVLQINPAYVSVYNSSAFDSVTQAELLNELRRLGLRVDQVATTSRDAARDAAAVAQLAAHSAQIAVQIAASRDAPPAKVPQLLPVPPTPPLPPVPPLPPAPLAPWNTLPLPPRPPAPPVMPPAVDEPPPSAKAVTVPPEANFGAGLAVIQTSCVACHRAGALKPTGQTFTLLDAKSNLMALTDAQKLTVIERVLAGEMPPAGQKPLTPEERLAVVGSMKKR